MKKTTIIKALTIAGFSATIYLAMKAVPFLEDYYEEYIAETNFSSTDTEKLAAKKKLVADSARAVAPAVLAGISTVLGICNLDKEHIKVEEKLLKSLYFATADLQLMRKQTEPEKLCYLFDPGEIPNKKLNKDEILVYEPYTDQIFPTTNRLIEKAMIKGDKRLNQYYTQTLNRFLKDLGGETCTFGDRIGWSCECESQMRHWEKEGPYISVKLSPQDVDGKTVYVMDYNVNPLWVTKNG